jgi:hypothetical protein
MKVIRTLRQSSTTMRAYWSVVALVVLSVGAASIERQGPEAVINGSAIHNLSDWRVKSSSDGLTMSRVKVDAPGDIETAVELRHRGARNEWAVVLVRLRSPEDFFEEGALYRMSASVRDLHGSGRSIGMLLANANFSHRPTTANQYASFNDRSWHTLQRTFTASGEGFPDTSVYFQLPPGRRLAWQITSVSVRETQLPETPRVLSQPSEVLTFDGPEGASPDRGTWSYEVGAHGWGNHELQAHTASQANASLDGNGNLRIVARREEQTGVGGPTWRYTSARLTTDDKLEIQPGSYVEASIRVPFEPGLIPAFWLLGANIEDVGWPACGELDVMETTQTAHTIRQTIHTSQLDAPSEDAPYGEFAPGGYTTLEKHDPNDSHRYGVYFDHEVVAFFVDGQERLRLTREEAYEKDRSWPFDRPLSIHLAIAVIEETQATRFPITMEVSEIRVWRGGVPLDLDRYVLP